MISRSIFDPGNPNVEHTGNTMTPADGRSYSNMPEDVVDGVIEVEEQNEFGQSVVPFDAAGQPVDASPPAEGQAGTMGNESPTQADDSGTDDVGQDRFKNPEEPYRPRPGA